MTGKMDDLVDIDNPSAAATPMPSMAGSLPVRADAAHRRAFSLSGLTLGSQPSAPVATTSTGRPGRYDAGVETRPLTPPSSSQNLQLVFDSSKVYDKHPRKYRLLLDTDKDLSATVSPTTSGQANPSAAQASPTPSVSLQDGRVVAMGTTSSGPTAETSAATAAATSRRDSGAGGGAQPKILVTSSDGSVKGSALPLTLSEAISSGKKPGSGRDPITGTTGDSRYVPQDFLEKFKAVTFNPSKTPAKQGAAPLQASAGMPSTDLPTSLAMQSTEMVPSGTAMPSQGPQSRSIKGGLNPCCAVVQPEPRRLFGFGPFFRPLPETVCGPKDGEAGHTAPGMARWNSSPTLSIPTDLTEAVQQKRLTGVGYSDSRRVSVNPDSTDERRSAAPQIPKRTPSEVNAWLTGPF